MEGETSDYKINKKNVICVYGRKKPSWFVNKKWQPSVPEMNWHQASVTLGNFCWNSISKKQLLLDNYVTLKIFTHFYISNLIGYFC